MVIPLSRPALAPLKSFLFGKVPAHGDFIARGLDDATLEAWDHWACGELEIARERLREGFDTAHETAGPWRFIAPGIGTEQDWMVGALATSIDSLGRRYLLIAGQAGLDANEAGALGFELCANVEAIIYQVMAEGLTADVALAALTSLTPTDTARRMSRQLAVRPANALWFGADEEAVFVKDGLPKGWLADSLVAIDKGLGAL